MKPMYGYGRFGRSPRQNRKHLVIPQGIPGSCHYQYLSALTKTTLWAGTWSETYESWFAMVPRLLPIWSNDPEGTSFGSIPANPASAAWKGTLSPYSNSLQQSRFYSYASSPALGYMVYADEANIADGTLNVKMHIQRGADVNHYFFSDDEYLYRSAQLFALTETSAVDWDADEDLLRYYWRTSTTQVQPISITSTRYTITAVNTGAKTFTVTGDHQAVFTADKVFAVRNSTGNNGVYSVVSTALSGSDTVITVLQTPPDATADGIAQVSDYRIGVYYNTTISAFTFNDYTPQTEIAALDDPLDIMVGRLFYRAAGGSPIYGLSYYADGNLWIAHPGINNGIIEFGCPVKIPASILPAGHLCMWRDTENNEVVFYYKARTDGKLYTGSLPATDGLSDVSLSGACVGAFRLEIIGTDPFSYKVGFNATRSALPGQAAENDGYVNFGTFGSIAV